MPHFNIDEIKECMNNPDNIRNISVIAHVDHGKSTLTDSLICRAGIISSKLAGDARFTDTRPDEQERGVTIKSTGVSLYFSEAELQNNLNGGAPMVGTEDSSLSVSEGCKAGYLINLIDSPGHVDFSSEVTAALRVTDGALVVVDCIEGCAVQTETVLRQALAEAVKPVLFVNKVDRCMLELKMPHEEMYLSFRRVVENVNVIISTYCVGVDLQVYPEKGTVAFGSGLHGWAFNIESFAVLYAKKHNIAHEKMMQRLWGDWFFDSDTKKWVTDSAVKQGSKTQKRGFCKFILEPIDELIQAVMNSENDRIDKIFSALNIHLKSEDRELTGKPLLKRAMQVFLPAADILLSMTIKHLPSPKVAQKYRVKNLYEGPMDDECATAIANCDPDGPLVMFISKMVPAEKTRFYAYGRVFSGRVYTGQKVRIQGPNYTPGKKENLDIKNIQRTVIMMGKYVESVSQVPCGNTCALVGVDQCILKSATITDCETAHNITPMRYSVSPVVRVAVKPKDGKDLPKLVEGLRRLSRSDPLVVCSSEKDGDHIVAGCGELHVEICLKDLREEYAQIDFTVSDPVVSYCETVSARSSRNALAKSPNKHNRLFVSASPLGDQLSADIESGKVNFESKEGKAERERDFCNEYDWDINEVRKIWAFGPDNKGANIMVDKTQGIQNMHEIKDSCVSAMQWISSEGPLCGEALRGIRFDILDVTLHADAIHRGSGQIMPVTRRACSAAFLLAQPRLQEPYYLCEIQCPSDAMSGVYATLNQRRGVVFDERQKEGLPTLTIRAHLPVSESFGFTASLRQKTSGQAFPQCVFDHWAEYPGDPLEVNGKCEQLVMTIRNRKSLKAGMPDLADFEDRL